jgi:hypothetical protein
VIVFAGEQRPSFKFGDESIRCGEFAVELLQQVVFLLRVGFFLRKMNIGLDVAVDGGELFIGGNLLFRAFPVAENALRGFLVVPEIGIRDARFEGFQALAILGRVKDSSARDGCAA